MYFGNLEIHWEIGVDFIQISNNLEYLFFVGHQWVAIFVYKNSDAISIYLFRFVDLKVLRLGHFFLKLFREIGSAFQNFKFSNLSCDDMS